MTPRAITWLRRYGVFVVWAGACALGYGLFPDIYEHWQLDLSSRTQELRGPRKPPSGVVIVGIDDYSLVQGQNADLSQDKDLRRLADWPWPRAIYDRVLDRLFSAGARVVGFDLLFDAPSSHGPEDDAALAAALRRHSGKVVLGAQVFESRGRVGGLTLSAAMPFLSEAAGPRSSGLLNGLQDPDGYIRLRPSTYAEQLRQSGMLDVPVGLSSQLIAKGRVAEIPPPPILASWRPLVDPYGPPRTIPTIPIWEVLESGSFARLKQQGTFRNQVVLIGPTASVLQDIHRTAFAGAEGMPGVEIHAAEIANRLEGRALYIPPNAWYLAPLLGFLVLALGLASARAEKPQVRLGALALLAGAMVLLGLILLSSTGAGIGLLGISALILATGLVSAGDATVRLQWNRLRLRRMLERYLSPAVAAQIASQPEEADELLGGKVSEVVVFICDVRGFTQRTTKMSKEGKATQLVQQLNEYFAVVVDTLQRKGAIIDKYMGDAVLAVFGVPLNRGMEVEVQSALEAILELQDQMEALNQRWAAQGKDPWEQVMILSGGPVISGNIGCASRMDYTVIGDTVNMASRLEGVAKQSGRDIILSRVVAEHASREWDLERVGEFEIRGQEAQEVFTMKPREHYERSQG
ncbi:adenylate/guanylate cyclase domain-containing protein [Synechococcus sp. CBW1107]|uniref:CHASE2 domain-containing protein n=1 Tax=Synechococcus sp. CBW1107 TaxID=2789857 RepID=UPI0018CE56B7|nr:adenylate/guanylate cyclase domain-containing protein [Synechococcus sp. CBW1107]QPN55506.1 adenylate/guanylate cyclase domain-containing protein [Synechococcus sp. CBW1107]